MEKGKYVVFETQTGTQVFPSRDGTTYALAQQFVYREGRDYNYKLIIKDITASSPFGQRGGKGWHGESRRHSEVKR